MLSVEVLFLGLICMVKGFKHAQSLCKFLLDEVCPHRDTVEKRKSFSIAGRCFRCSLYHSFLIISDEEDERLMDGIDRIHELTARFERGEIGKAEYERLCFKIDKEIDGC